MIISLITLVESIFSGEFGDNKKDQINVSFTLFQMSSLFEAGITLACIVIIHNWFKEEILGSVTAFWISVLINLCLGGVSYKMGHSVTRVRLVMGTSHMLPITSETINLVSFI